MSHSEQGNEFLPRANKPTSVVLKQPRAKPARAPAKQAPPIADYIHDLEERNQRLRIEITKIRENIKELDQSD
jgi:hypothetical protein